MSEKPITVLIVDDHEMVRIGLRSMLTAPHIHVIGEADSGQSALKMIPALKPDIVLMDIRMPDMDGIAALESLNTHDYRPRVIMITTYKSSIYLLRSLAAGAAGFVLKDISREMLLNTIQSVASGEQHVDQEFLQSVLQQLNEEDANADTLSNTDWQTPLTTRESEVLQLIVAGLTYQAMAQVLGVSSHTIKEHAQRIYQKLDVTNRTEAAVKAIRIGLVK